MIVKDGEIIKRYQDGESVRQIAQDYGGDHTIVTYCLARNKIPPRSKQKSNAITIIPINK